MADKLMYKMVLHKITFFRLQLVVETFRDPTWANQSKFNKSPQSSWAEKKTLS